MNVTPDLLKQCTDGMAPQSFQPLEADVQMLCEFTSVDRAQAIILLRKWKNVEEAAGHYFENPTAALREEGTDRVWERQDNIAYNDEQVGTALPPSPTGYNNSSRFIDLSPQHAQAQAQFQTDHELEQDQYNRAIAESMQDPHWQQQNGTTHNSHHPQFGPAQRQHHEPDRWALQPIASARELIDHPPPHKRRRLDQTPAMLLGSAHTEYLAPLLNIYHTIPLAREALLTQSFNPSSYPYTPEWWQGSTDHDQQSAAVEQYGLGREARFLLLELQRLMAFLDASHRAYATVDRLAGSRIYKAHYTDSSLSRLAQVWQNYAIRLSPDDPITQVFSTTAVKAVGVNGSPEVRRHMVCIEGPRDTAQDPNELLYKIVWNDTPNDVLDDVCLERVGEVFTIRVFNESPQLPLQFTVTETWYFDRYTPECRELALVMRRKCMEIKNEILKLSEIRRNLTYMPGANTPSVSIRHILDQAKTLMTLATSSSTTAADVPPQRQLDNPAIYTAMEQFVLSIDERLQALATREAELEIQIKDVSSDMSDPATSSRPLKRRYELQGVSTKPNITYIRRHDTSHVNIDGTSADEHTSSVTWWRLASGDSVHHSSRDNAPKEEIPAGLETEAGALPYSVEQVTFEDVVNAVKTDYHAAVLVYASTLAMNRPPVQLSEALHNFIQQDNEMFQQELMEEQGQQYHGRVRTWSNDTGSTVRDDIDPFHDETYPIDVQEATPISTETNRSEDGQPSPKRPRSSDDSKTNNGLSEQPPAYDAVFHGSQHEMKETGTSTNPFFTQQATNPYGMGPALPPRPPPKGG